MVGLLLNSGGGEGGCNRLQTAIALVSHWQLAPKCPLPLTIINLVISTFKARQWPKNQAYNCDCRIREMLLSGKENFPL